MTVFGPDIRMNHKAIFLLQDDAENIKKLIKVQFCNEHTRACPLYQEVLDTQMYGFSQKVNFAVKVGLIEEATGKLILEDLDRDISLI